MRPKVAVNMADSISLMERACTLKQETLSNYHDTIAYGGVTGGAGGRSAPLTFFIGKIEAKKKGKMEKKRRKIVKGNVGNQNEEEEV